VKPLGDILRGEGVQIGTKYQYPVNRSVFSRSNPVVAKTHPDGKVAYPDGGGLASSQHISYAANCSQYQSSSSSSSWFIGGAKYDTIDDVIFDTRQVVSKESEKISSDDYVNLMVMTY